MVNCRRRDGARRGSTLRLHRRLGFPTVTRDPEKGTGWRRAWEPGHEGQVGRTVRSWGAEEGLLGAFLVGPGDWLRAREDSQRFTGTEGLRSFEGILPAHALLAHRPTSPGRACPLLPENAQRTSCSLISQCLEEGACGDGDTGLPQEGVAFWDGAGFGVYWLRPPKTLLLPPFFRGEIKAPNGEVFSQGPTTIWRQVTSSSLLFSFPAHVFVFFCFFGFFAISRMCLAPGHRRLCCV